MSFTDALSKLGQVLPAVKKPEQKPSLNQKLLWSIVGVIVYLVMSSVPLYGIQSSALSNFLLEQVIFASTAGTLAQLGIGPIITAGLIMQILVGSKLINLNLSTEDDKAKFTEAQKGLAFLFILLESFLFGFALTRSTGFSNLTIPLAVAGQLVVATYFILLLDELIQKGWGLGSGVSLFILAGTMKIYSGICSASSTCSLRICRWVSSLHLLQL
jgi:protein translocase subunit secY/sec61 alpha